MRVSELSDNISARPREMRCAVENRINTKLLSCNHGRPSMDTHGTGAAAATAGPRSRDGV